MMSGLVKMKIAAWTDNRFQDEAGAMEVMINPEKYTHQYRIEYTDPQAQGSNGGSPKFRKIPSEEVQFELIFDATGVVPPGKGEAQSPADGVTGKIRQFRSLISRFDGRIHSPKFVTLTWGTFLFKGRLSSLDLTYTLFRPDGTPLRAHASTRFIGYQSEEELAKEANKSSPDLSHLVTVKAGDTLPLLCDRIYGSSAYYVQVARANGLTDFRRIAPGTRLLFPPLGDAAA
jgi:hypothetical protein